MRVLERPNQHLDFKDREIQPAEVEESWFDYPILYQHLPTGLRHGGLGKALTGFKNGDLLKVLVGTSVGSKKVNVGTSKDQRRLKSIPSTRPVRDCRAPEADPSFNHPVGRATRQSVLAVPDRSCLGTRTFRLPLFLGHPEAPLRG